jgi:uncharacterized protein
MTREEANQILNKYLTNKNLTKHSLAAEAAMKAIYRHLYPDGNAQDEEKWGITGLLHDADYELSKGHPEQHGLLLFEKEPTGIPQDIAHAIKAHNYEYTKVVPLSKMDWAIACADQLTGLIVAAALVHPDKKLASITPEFVLNRMKEKSFAKGAMREPILLCDEKLSIPLQTFVALVLTAMQGIHNELEL